LERKKVGEGKGRRGGKGGKGRGGGRGGKREEMGTVGEDRKGESAKEEKSQRYTRDKAIDDRGQQ